MHVVITVLVVLLLGQSAHADDSRDYLDKFGIDRNATFSGTRHMESKDGQIAMAFRQAPQKMRIDKEIGGHTMTVIHREDLGKNYMLIPQMNMYREVTHDQTGMTGADLEFSEVSKVGSEVVNGFPCVKYRAQFQDARGGRARGHYWVNEHGILMKMDMIYQGQGEQGERLIIELRDLKIGPQDPAYFEVPAGYAEMSLGMGGGGPAAFSAANDRTRADDAYEEPGLGEQVEEAVEEEAEAAVVDEARESVRKGLKKLFGN